MIANGSGEDQSRKDYYFRMEYPDDYKTYQTKIIKFDRDYNKEMIYNFYGLFPKALNSTPVKYEGSETLKATVLFTFDRYSAGKYSSYDRYRGAYNNIRDENAMRRIETKAIADDSGLSQKEAAIIQAGGFVETVIE